MLLVQVDDYKLEEDKRLAIVASFRKISVSGLKGLGYSLGKRQSLLGQKPHRFRLIEVLNDDNTGLPDFAYLYSSESKEGIILPHSFEYYSKHPLT